MMGPRRSISPDQIMFVDPEFREEFEALLRTEIERAEEQGGDVWLVELAPAGLARWRTSPAPIWNEDVLGAFGFEPAEGIEDVPEATVWRRRRSD